MAQNRLKLDFSIQYTDERADFLNKYIQQEQFKNYPPTATELETMSNYVLWGKDKQTGLNEKQTGNINLTSRSGDWDNDNRCESLDALMESPTFSESAFRTIDRPPTKIKREVFSRTEALAQCPDFLRDTFKQLFRQIDKSEIMINFYELAHNKRINPPRDQLLSRFAADELTSLQEAALRWTQHQYLKQRHSLIEMRRQQYTLRDSFVHTLPSAPTTTVIEPAELPDFEAGIEVLPLGIWDKSAIQNLVFRDWSLLNPFQYSDEELTQISDFYWKKRKYKPSGQEQWIDFRELEHVYQLFQMYYELNEEDIEGQQFYTKSLMRALKFYTDAADLTELQREILDMKIQKKKNVDIAYEINQKWGKSYTPNYISTIFRQRIIPKINEAARYHELVISNLFFPEEFKACADCGRILLKDPINFTRKTRSKDGFTSKCKKCEKAARNK